MSFMYTPALHSLHFFRVKRDSEPRVIQIFIQFSFKVKNGLLSLPGWGPGP